MSDAGRWARVTEVFQEALERDVAARTAYLDIACAGDGLLRAEVESLLAAHVEAGRFANGSPMEALPSSAVEKLGDGVAPSKSSLASGTRLGPYEIVGPIGAGGMGELFRARDTRLGRDVAIKVPFTAVAGDPARQQRFLREGRAIAALNHPHICTVHDVGSESGVDYLVLELLQGESLALRLKRGALPVDEALARAIEIAGALARAHRDGIVHRDFKPGNVMLTPSGAKVLDFGLARITRGDTDAPMSTDGRATAPLTGSGAVLGTIQYMAPEQLEGRVADARSDIYAFGATLYEMLIGKRAFEAILRGETPSLLAVQADLPPALERIVGTCLAKDPEARFASMHDVAMGLEWLREEDRTDAPLRTDASNVLPRRRSSITIAVVALTAAVLSAVVTWVAQQPGASPLPTFMRLEVVPSQTDPINVGTTTPTLAITRDGTRLAYTSGSGGAAGPLVIRDLGELMPRRVEGAPLTRAPFFSPDGHWVGYFTGDGLKKIATVGGTPVDVVSDAAINPRGASWADDGTIVYATSIPETGLLRVSDGGMVAVLTKPNRDKGEADHVFPAVLPGGRGILFTILDAAADNPRVAVFDSSDQSERVLIPGAASAQYVDAGYIVYAASGTLFAVRFNLNELRVEGEPLTLANDVLTGAAGGAYYAVSPAGTIAYVPATATPDPPRTLVWVDRRGTETPLNAPPRAYRSVRLSPDGQRIAVGIADQQPDVWTWDLQRLLLTQVTSDRREDSTPIWTPDGKRLVFQSRRSGAANVFLQSADGTGVAEPLTTGPVTFVPTSVTGDGAYLLGNSSLPRAWTLFVLPLGKQASPKPILQSAANHNYPAVSPNARFVAYQSDESGRAEIWVRPFPNMNDERSQVSTAGGRNPVWARNGRELFFLDASNRLTAVSVDTAGPTFRAGLPVRLLSTAYGGAGYRLPYDVSLDGTRFLMMKEDPSARPPNTPIVVLLNAVTSLESQGAGGGRVQR